MTLHLCPACLEMRGEDHLCAWEDQMVDMTDIVVAMQKVDACHEPLEANALLTAGSQEIARLRSLGRKIPRPWIDGGITFKEWCDAVDAFLNCPR